MSEPLSDNSNMYALPSEDDITWHEPPSSPFIAQVEQDQENIAPMDLAAATPSKPLIDFDMDFDVPQSAFKVSSSPKAGGLKERASPTKATPAKHALEELDDAALNRSMGRTSPKKMSPSKPTMAERPDSAMSNLSRHSRSPSKSSQAPSAEPIDLPSELLPSVTDEELFSPVKRPSSSHMEPTLRDNEGLTVAMKNMGEINSQETPKAHYHREELPDMGVHLDDTDFDLGGPDFTSGGVDDTCFSDFSEMPTLNMTKFAFLKKSPTKNGELDPTTPRSRAQMTPSTVRRTERTPSPTPRRHRKDNDTTNLLLDFTAQIEAFGSSQRHSPNKGRHTAVKSGTEPNLLAYYNNQRSPGKASSFIPSTPSQGRQLLNLLDFELPPPPTPRSMPTVTIRELESLKSTFQSQISSLTASLSGKEAQVDSLVKAISDAERRVGEAQECVRDERSAREHAEAQMEDWKKKGEEVQKLLQDVQAELAHNDSEREALLARLAEVERRADDAEQRCADQETRAIEAESKNVDMTTFIDHAEDKKMYSEAECQAAIAEKVNEVARDLHTAYKAKHEKKIKALKENYQKKADERCKELRVQIVRLERQIEDGEKKRDDTFSNLLPDDANTMNGTAPCDKCDTVAKQAAANKAEDVSRLERQKADIENLKAKLAGLQSELASLRTSHAALALDLEAERVEKGELVAAAEQMLVLCGDRMEELQQGGGAGEQMKRSTMGKAPPTANSGGGSGAEGAMRATGFMAGGPSRPGSALGGGRPGSAMGERLGAMSEKSHNSSMGSNSSSGGAKPSGLRAPGGFGFQGNASSNAGASGSGGGHARSMSSGKSRIMSNIERMGGGRTRGGSQSEQ